jgi:type I restriction enzyme S subunit
MAGEWPTATVSELQRDGVLLVEDGNHGEYRPRPDEFVDTGVAFIRAADMNSGRVLFETAARINEKARARITKGIGAAGDVLLSHKGTVGKVALVGDDAPSYVCSPQTTFWRTLDQARLDRKYLYAFLRSAGFHTQLATRAGETDMAPYVSLTSQRGLFVTVPPIGTQRAIAHILGTLDDKIELNRRMNETLEAMARALFKSWFVDFDPVRAKAEGRDPGLPQPLADLFPDSFEDSELGEIPRGWGIGRFGDVVEQLRDQENPLASPSVLFHHFSIPAFDEGQSPKPDYGESIKSLKSRVPAGVILLSKLNPEIERVWMVDVHTGERAVCSTEFLVLRAMPPFTRSYVYCLARSPLFRQQIEGLVTGTSKSHQRAQVDSILNLPVVISESPLVEAFEECVSSLLSRTLDCRREGYTLVGLRNALLPKFISGELRVPFQSEVTVKGPKHEKDQRR